MNRPLLPFVRWLTLAAVADWLLTRTLTRSAIHMPKSPLVITLYEGFGLAGQIALTLSSLLALGVLIWIAWYEWRTQRALWLPLLLISRAIFGLLFLVVMPVGWLAVGNHLLSLTAVSMIVSRMWRKRTNVPSRIAILFPALALVLGELYQVGPALYATLHLSGPPLIINTLFNLGELFVVLSAVALWWAYGRTVKSQNETRSLPRVWLIAAVPALIFSVMYIVDPAMTGIIAIWSTGLTLYLPWPMYTVSLWLVGITVINSLRQGELVGWAILLLAAGGYSPQLSTHVFLGLIALWLLGSEPMILPAVVRRPSFGLRRLRIRFPAL